LLILGGSCPERVLGDGIDPVHVPEEMDDVLLPRQRRQIALDGDSIEAVIYQPEELAKEVGESIRG
jgi:hypothetical protein